jgi:protein-glutamine gamma-glutamyltransferase
MATATSNLDASSPGSIAALRRHFEVSLYLLLLTSVLTLTSTGKLDLASILIPPLALLVKGYRWWRGHGPELSNRVATWITLAYFVFFPFDLWMVSRTLAGDAQRPALYAALLATIHLMVFAILVRLFSATTTRDYLFLILMSFTTMLASAILTVDTVFVFFFFLFLAFAISTFVSLEMWRAAHGAAVHPIPVGTREARRLHSALGITSVGIAVGSLTIGAFIFLFIPRVSGGYISGFNLQPTLISGFTDNVELGEIGEIKKSSQVVMRITVDGGLDAARGVHWRGVALTRFDGRRWYNEPHEPTTITSTEEGWVHFDDAIRNDKRAGMPIHYTVLLEPVASSALFFANEVVSVRGRFGVDADSTQRRTYLLEDPTGSIFNPFHNFARIEYEARSLLPTPPPAALRLSGTKYPADVLENYLQLPKLDPRIPDLAAQITARQSTPYDKARTMEGYLRAHYGYTLDLAGTPQPDPLAYFLFTRRAGHCEYFAAAMTVMLRSVGIPARYINGFQTGEYNSVGGDFVVRASDAHSWVEVYFPNYGWITFDPTPPGEEKTTGLFEWAARYWDWFELQWSEWVINYDFVHQFAMVQSLHRISTDWSQQMRAAFDRMRRAATDRVESWQTSLTQSGALIPVVLGLIAAFCCFVLLLQPRVRRRLGELWHLRVGASRTMTPHLASLQYREMLRLLEQKGIRKAPGQTANEFAAALPDVNLAGPVHELTSVYHDARFGGRSTDPRRSTFLLDRIRVALRPQQ